MADLKSTIDDLVVGDDYDVIRDLSNVPTGQALTQGKLTVKENPWDSVAIITKTITGAATSHGVISDTGAGDTVAKIKFSLLGSETVLLKPHYRYYYDIEVTTDAAKVYTPESGTMKPFHQITV